MSNLDKGSEARSCKSRELKEKERVAEARGTCASCKSDFEVFLADQNSKMRTPSWVSVRTLIERAQAN